MTQPFRHNRYDMIWAIQLLRHNRYEKPDVP